MEELSRHGNDAQYSREKGVLFSLATVLTYMSSQIDSEEGSSRNNTHDEIIIADADKVLSLLEPLCKCSEMIVHQDAVFELLCGCLQCHQNFADVNDQYCHINYVLYCVMLGLKSACNMLTRGRPDEIQLHEMMYPIVTILQKYRDRISSVPSSFVRMYSALLEYAFHWVLTQSENDSTHDVATRIRPSPLKKELLKILIWLHDYASGLLPCLDIGKMMIDSQGTSISSSEFMTTNENVQESHITTILKHYSLPVSLVTACLSGYCMHIYHEMEAALQSAINDVDTSNTHHPECKRPKGQKQSHSSLRLGMIPSSSSGNRCAAHVNKCLSTLKTIYQYMSDLQQELSLLSWTVRDQFFQWHSHMFAITHAMPDGDESSHDSMTFLSHWEHLLLSDTKHSRERIIDDKRTFTQEPYHRSNAAIEHVKYLKFKLYIVNEPSGVCSEHDNAPKIASPEATSSADSESNRDTMLSGRGFSENVRRPEQRDILIQDDVRFPSEGFIEQGKEQQIRALEMDFCESCIAGLVHKAYTSCICEITDQCSEYERTRSQDTPEAPQGQEPEIRRGKISLESLIDRHVRNTLLERFTPCLEQERQGNVPLTHEPEQSNSWHCTLCTARMKQSEDSLRTASLNAACNGGNVAAVHVVRKLFARRRKLDKEYLQFRKETWGSELREACGNAPTTPEPKASTSAHEVPNRAVNSTKGLNYNNDPPQCANSTNAIASFPGLAKLSERLQFSSSVQKSKETTKSLNDGAESTNQSSADPISSFTSNAQGTLNTDSNQLFVESCILYICKQAVSILVTSQKLVKEYKDEGSLMREFTQHCLFPRAIANTNHSAETHGTDRTMNELITIGQKTPISAASAFSGKRNARTWSPMLSIKSTGAISHVQSLFSTCLDLNRSWQSFATTMEPLILRDRDLAALDTSKKPHVEVCDHTLSKRAVPAELWNDLDAKMYNILHEVQSIHDFFQFYIQC